MKFRKKPVVVEAEQFTRNHLPKGCTGNEELLCCFINTPEGVMRADLGDWIITGVKGEKYPCKPDIFKMTYEKVEQVKENEELVQKAIDALGNCNEDICPCIEDVLSYLEAIKEGK